MPIPEAEAKHQSEETVIPDGWDGGAPAAAVLPRITERRPSPFLFFVSPGEVLMYRGKPYPRPSMISITPGIGGIGSNVKDLRMLHMEQQRFGRRVVPPTVEVQAFGEPVKGYCKRIRTQAGAHYVTVWERVRTVGDRVYWQRDQDGYEKFLQFLQGFLAIDEVDPAVVEEALAPIRAELTILRSAPSNDVHSYERARQLEAVHPSLRRDADTQAPPTSTTSKAGKK